MVPGLEGAVLLPQSMTVQFWRIGAAKPRRAPSSWHTDRLGSRVKPILVDGIRQRTNMCGYRNDGIGCWDSIVTDTGVTR